MGAEWIAKLPPKSQPVAQLLAEQYDAVEKLRADGEKQMKSEARQHPVTKRLETIPGIGPIRAAQLVPIVVSPHRLRTKRQLWKYAGLAIMTRSSSDWVKGKDGSWCRQDVQQTRGLNRNFNATLKSIFKGAATTVIGRADAVCPIYQHYRSMIDNKTKPNLAKLTIARQSAAITLAVWKKEDVYAPAKVKKSS